VKQTAIVSIVEGHGEVKALPILLNRAREKFASELHLKIYEPIRVKVNRFLRSEQEFYKYIRLASERAANLNGHVLILLDCEDDCPAKNGPTLLERAKQIREDVSFIVVLASREYETWFIAAANSLRGVSGLPADLTPPSNPERIRGAKEWLSRHLSSGYDEVRHQFEFTRAFDFDEASSVESFSRLLRKLRVLMTSATPSTDSA
jgi:hypothetical protein